MRTTGWDAWRIDLDEAAFQRGHALRVVLNGKRDGTDAR